MRGKKRKTEKWRFRQHGIELTAPSEGRYRFDFYGWRQRHKPPLDSYDWLQFSMKPDIALDIARFVIESSGDEGLRLVQILLCNMSLGDVQRIGTVHVEAEDDNKT